MPANALLCEHQTSTALQKICQKCPRIKAEVSCWTGRGAKMHEEQLALLPVSCLSWQSCSGVPRRLLQSPESASPALPRNNHTAHYRLHYIRASSLSAPTNTMTSSSSSSSSSECNVEQILDRPCNAADRLLARRLLPRKRLLSFSALLHSALPLDRSQISQLGQRSNQHNWPSDNIGSFRLIKRTCSHYTDSPKVPL